MNKQAAFSSFVMSSWKNSMTKPFPMKHPGASFSSS
jgi:hypothetical protein